MVDVEATKSVDFLRDCSQSFAKSIELVIGLAHQRIEDSLEEAGTSVGGAEDLYGGDSDR